MKKVTLVILTLLLTVSAFASDILILNNERVFNGKVTKIGKCEIIFKVEGHKYTIPASDIFSIQFEDTNNKIYRKYVKSLDKDPNKCLAAQLDVKNYHGRKVGHAVLGFLFGPAAMLGTAVSNPTPDRGKHTYIMSKNSEYFSDTEYLNCYRNTAKTSLLQMEALGWAASLLILLLL